MDVGNQGQRTFKLDLPEGPGRLLIGHRQAGHLAARRGQAPDLGQRGPHVPGVGVGHALHHHRGPAADLDRTDEDGPGGLPPYLDGYLWAET